MVTVLLVVGTTAVAHAHPAIDRGVERYEEADFAGALQALRAAERSGELSRTELLRLLATRALVHFALDRSEPMQHALTTLASISPDYELGPRAPPAVRKAFDHIRSQLAGRIGIDVSVDSTPGGVRLQATAEHDAAGAVEQIALVARVGDGQWQRARGGRLVLPAWTGAVVEYYARAIGPGGAPLVDSGSEDHPHRVRLREPDGEASGATTALPDRRQPPSSRGRSPWLWAGIGGGVALVAGSIVLGVMLARSDAGQKTVLVPPMVGGEEDR